MPRALTGSIVPRPGGRFQASIRIATGSPERRYELFDTKRQAQAWCALAAANLSAGLPLPSRDAVLGDADPSRRARKPSSPVPVPEPIVRMTVEQVADAWFHEVYVDGRSGGADRANTVRAMLNRRVVPFLQPVVDAGKPLTREMYRSYLVDLHQGLVRIRVQATTSEAKRELPKLKKIRDIAIPRDAPAGFSLVDWLPGRIEAALAEQAAGDNPRALIFPNPSGGVYEEQNLRNRVWAPAAEDLGWAMEHAGSDRRLMRFTLHSLRDRYANTALHHWHYTEEILLQQGSWKDPETVRRFYPGITDQTLNQAKNIHGWGIGM